MRGEENSEGKESTSSETATQESQAASFALLLPEENNGNADTLRVAIEDTLKMHDIDPRDCLEVFCAKGDANVQVKQLEEAAAAGKEIFLWPIDAEAVWDAAARAIQADTHIILLEAFREVEGAGRICSDAAQGASLCEEALSDGASVAIVGGEHPLAQAVFDALAEDIKNGKAGASTLVGTIPLQDSSDLTAQQVAMMLEKDPEITVLVAGSEEDARGCVEGISRGGRTGEVAVIAVTDSQEIREEVAVGKLLGALAAFYGTMGEEAVEQMLAWEDGHAAPKTVYIPMAWIDADHAAWPGVGED